MNKPISKPHYGGPLRKSRDITGQHFGKLVALQPSRKGKYGWVWVLQCDCGAKQQRVLGDLVKSVKHGGTPACPACRKEAQRALQASHGMSKHPVYAVWRDMRGRCHLPSHQAWHNYGARGIQVCDAWAASFGAFWKDMGPTYESGLTLDRKNNEGHYEKENCRWVSFVTQANNRRGNRYLDTPAGRMTVAQASRKYGIGQTTILYRLDHGLRPLSKSSTSSTAGQGTAS